ncbi:bifunctional riboflavin kinase/FAD synthetase [Bacteroides heparinolyticus]|uniref:bifunctional riboflavin kinase/FAD synthetase n=2 Tax=Prevotella heparinolytica TaxID=28113 RepID=UPI002A9B58DB|nr:bifunctional riboflavin kinase/FAD synthetase [Prevotella sp.]
MNTIYLGREEVKKEPCVATIGFFDGVHLGHRYLIGEVTKAARESGRKSVVVTFDRHPREVLQSSFRPELLSTLPEKLQRLSQTEADYCVVMPFDRETAAYTAHDFMEKVLRNRLGVERLVIGYDNRFGRNRSEGMDDYVRFGHELGMEVSQADAMRMEGVNVSSTVIRGFLSQGEVEKANRCLGYAYSLSGMVESGYRIGRKIGFPTANLSLSGCCKLVPQEGVYAVRVTVEGEKIQRPGMMNIGKRPTFDGRRTTAEVHVIGYKGDLYGQMLTVEFVHRLREERSFDGIEQLTAQLQEDKRQVTEWFDREKDAG